MGLDLLPSTEMSITCMLLGKLLVGLVCFHIIKILGEIRADPTSGPNSCLLNVSACRCELPNDPVPSFGSQFSVCCNDTYFFNPFSLLVELFHFTISFTIKIFPVTSPHYSLKALNLGTCTLWILQTCLPPLFLQCYGHIQQLLVCANRHIIL